jgi:hypothetical protein
MCGNYWDQDDESVKWHDELMKWHNKRSRDILITIVESDFGNRIQKLRIYASQTDTLGLQMGVCALRFNEFTAHFNLQTC